MTIYVDDHYSLDETDCFGLDEEMAVVEVGMEDELASVLVQPHDELPHGHVAA